MPAGFDNRKAHLVCGHSDEAADAPVYAAGFQKHVCAKGVIHGESQAVAKGVVYMCLHEQCHFSSPSGFHLSARQCH